LRFSGLLFYGRVTPWRRIDGGKEGRIRRSQVKQSAFFLASAATNAVVLVFNAMKLTLGGDDTFEITRYERLSACRSDKPLAK